MRAIVRLTPLGSVWRRMHWIDRMRSGPGLSGWIGFLSLALCSAVSVWASPDVSVVIDGQAEVAPAPRPLWEGQHLTFSARLLKRHERELLHYLPLQQVRTHDSDPSLEQISPERGLYDFTVIDQFIEDLKGLGTSERGPGLLMNLEFTPRWLAETSCPNRPSRFNPPTDLDAWAEIVEATVRHIRQQAPAMERYYEVWNEPNLEDFWMPCERNRTVARQRYFRFYEKTARAVKRGDAAAKVGGPSIALDNEMATLRAWIPSFLDYCRDNNIPLHFVSFHRYEGRDIRLDTQDGSSVRGWLQERQLDNVEILNTEWNLSSDMVSDSAAAEAMYGAGIPARILSMYKGTINRSVYFSGPGVPEELILPDERVRPIYNVFRMLDVLKGNMVATISDGLSDDGTGVGVLATSQRADNLFAILLWNYRYNDFSASPVQVNLNAIQWPDFLQQRPVAYQRYLVDAQTSNWKATPLSDHLQPVDLRTLPPSSGYAEPILLQPNAVTLLVFCRQSGPCPDLTPASTYLGPIIQSPFVNSIRSNSAIVTWSTDRPSTTKVEYGTSLTYGGETETDSTLRTQHRMTLRNLVPNTTYYFRAVSRDGAGRETKSEDWWLFTTPPPGRIKRVFKPADNTFVDSDYCMDNPDASFATASVLSLRNTRERSFLRFDLSALSEEDSAGAEAAELRLFAADYGDSGGRLYQTQEVSWRETDVNCAWQPRLQGAPIDALYGPVANGYTYSFNATPVLRQGSITSFGLDQPVRWSKVAYTSTRHYGPPPLLFITLPDQGASADGNEE